DIVFREELDALAARKAATVYYRSGPRSQAPDPFDPDVLRRVVPDLDRHDVFLCGPPGMIVAVREALRMAGVPARRIHVEAFEL
ncbi:MAG TPA: ferric reductase, partial [Acidimicrobiia bacterium]|nr:ferric reductase [Acidimicrobiia bacterium]